jgi:hypothetical protein
MNDYKSKLLAVLWLLNIITFREYTSRSLHDWELKNRNVNK